jgi:hypothetical protein
LKGILGGGSDRNIVFSVMQEKLGELVEDKHARLALLQLLAPDKARYLQAELLSVVNPKAEAAVPATVAAPAAAADAPDGSDGEGEDLQVASCPPHHHCD